jgi:V/A-type H+/Na+-transporting ATPase subunit C
MDIEPDMTRAMKTFNRVPRYGTAVGRIMMHEATLLNWQRIERLIESGFADCITVLLDTEYGPFLEGATVAAEVERALMSFLVAQYELLDSICVGTYVPDFMHLKYDFHNIKVLVKLGRGETRVEGLLSGLGSLDTDRLAHSVQGGGGNLGAFWEGLIAGLKREIDLFEGPEAVDTVADRVFLERRLAIAQKEKSRLLVDFSRAAIDVANLKILLRGRVLGKHAEYYSAALASGGRLDRGELAGLAGDPQDRFSARLLATKYYRMLEDMLHSEDRTVRLTSLDRDTDGFLLEKLAGMRRMALGPERIVRYMLMRENEVTLLRVVLMGKLHGVSAPVIERRLSSTYARGGVQV